MKNRLPYIASFWLVFGTMFFISIRPEAFLIVVNFLLTALTGGALVALFYITHLKK